MSPWPALVTVATLLMYLVITINVGRARFKYKVPPPQMTGDPNFERVVRVHQNTLEQMVFFLPALWLFCFYVDPRWGAGLGAVWVMGRIVYAIGYYQATEKRGPGFAIGSLSSMALLVGALIGIGRELMATYPLF